MTARPVGRTLTAELDQRAADLPDKPFCLFGDVALTFADAQRRSRSAANRLVGLGVQPDDVVALLMANRAEWVCAWLATLQMGAVSMPINVMFRGEFLRHQLQDSRAKVVVVDELFLPQLCEIASELTDVETVLVVGGAPAPGFTDSVTVRDAATLFDGPTDAVMGGRPIPWNEPACLFYTSGTTGPSKGVVLTQQYLCTAADVLTERYGLLEDDVVYSALPLFHLGGAQSVLVGSLVSGRTAVLDPAFSVTQCWDRVRKHGATVFAGVGPMLAMLNDLPSRPDDAELPIRLVLAAPVPAPLQAAVEARYHCTVAQVYGQTEALPLALTDVVAGGAAPGSAGTLGVWCRTGGAGERDVASASHGVSSPRSSSRGFAGVGVRWGRARRSSAGVGDGPRW